MKIYVAGHNGLVGSAIVNAIENQKKFSWVGKSRTELDLLDNSKILKFLTAEKPDALIIAAAKVGGIKANKDFPVEFLSENLQIQTNLINSAYQVGIEKVLFLASSCIYPKYSPQPIKEEYLLSGQLEPTNEAYAIAKIAGLKLIQAYRTEYSKNWISIMPTNIYGPRDNFDPNSSHVLPALIRKFHDAKQKSSEAVELWGSGNPRREFLHSYDLADAVLYLLENYDGDVPLNVGTGTDMSIRELAELIKSEVGFNGKIIWNENMPDGTPQKLLDVSKLNHLGWKPKISLEQGIKQTYSWFQKNY